MRLKRVSTARISSSGTSSNIAALHIEKETSALNYAFPPIIRRHDRAKATHPPLLPSLVSSPPPTSVCLRSSVLVLVLHSRQKSDNPCRPRASHPHCAFDTPSRRVIQSQGICACRHSG